MSEEPAPEPQDTGQQELVDAEIESVGEPGPPTMLSVVVGSEGPLGRAVVDELVLEGRSVRAVSLGPPGIDRALPEGVEEASADPRQAGSITEAVQGASLILYCFEPSYEELKKDYQEITGNVLLSSIEVGSEAVFASHLVESQDDNVRVEKEIVNSASSGLTRTAVARLPQLCGPWVMNPLYNMMFESAVEGKTAHWVGDPDAKRTYLDVRDAAKAMVLLGKGGGAFGKVWNVASPSPLTGREIIELAFRGAGNEPRVGKWGRGIALTGSLLAPEPRAILEMPYNYDRSFVLDGSDFAATFPEFEYTPVERTIAEAVAWYRGHNSRDIKQP